MGCLRVFAGWFAMQLSSPWPTKSSVKYAVPAGSFGTGCVFEG